MIKILVSWEKEEEKDLALKIYHNICDGVIEDNYTHVHVIEGKNLSVRIYGKN